MTDAAFSPELEPRPSRKAIIIGSVAALAVAGAALVFFVLPAEFGIDLTGSGQASGLNELAGEQEMTEAERGAMREGTVLTLSDANILTDRYERVLAPFEMVEFKYTMQKGAPLIFSWSASAPLQYDMHAHPFEGGEKMTESYSSGESRGMKGSYIAPFTGIHGWYWQNRSMDNVTLVLEGIGGFTTSTLFEGGPGIERPVEGGETAPSAMPAGHAMQQ